MSTLKASFLVDKNGNPLAPYALAEDKVIVVGSTGDYPTLRQAVNAYGDRIISRNNRLTFQLQGQVIADTAATIIENPFFGRARIIGAAPIDITLTSIASTSGSTGAWSQVLNVSSTTGYTVGSYILFDTLSAGTLGYRLYGCHKITAIGSGQITVLNRSRHASVASGAVTGNGRVLTSVLQVPGGVNGIQVYTKLGGYPGGGLTDFVIATSGSLGMGLGALAGGVVIGQNFSAGSTLTMGFDGFDWNCHAADGGMIGLTSNLSSMACSSGATGGCYSSHRGSYLCIYGKAVASGGSQYGLNSDSNSLVMAGWDNSGQGVRATGNATNFYCYGGGIIRRYNSAIEDPVTTNAAPALNTVGQGNSYIE